MATFTIPHHKFQNCKELKTAVSGAYRKIKSGKAWMRAREQHGWLGDVRALEITHGENGWHPHLHVLFFFRPGTSKETMQSFGGWLFDAWAGAIKRLGYGDCKKSAFQWDVTSPDGGAADYVSKWGAALELTKAHLKKGRGGRTPWQILSDYANDRSEADRRLFREYALAFKGARQLTWSRGLREMHIKVPEASDKELTDDPQASETQTAAMSRELFKAVVAKGGTAHILAADETGGLIALTDTLTQFGIPWHLSEIPGLERGRFVPFLSLGPPREPRGSIPSPF